jgi:hypothetical protein
MTYEFKTKPFEHQNKLFQETREMASFGVLWEQGCGKTKPLIDTACDMYERGEIDAVLTVAPGGVERNWVTDEIPTHMPDRVGVQCHSWFWQSKRAGAKYHKAEFEAVLKYQGLAWMCISYDAFMTERGKKAVWRFLKRRRCLYILDESDDIRTPKAKRTRSVGASGKYAPYRRILTGTPADKPFDLYSQLRFLDEGIWRRRDMATFAAFKQYFGVWFTRADAIAAHGYDPGYDKLVDYKNQDELAEILASVSSRLLKEDVLDLPDKLYTKRHFDMTPKQKSLYDQLRDELEIELEDGRRVDGELAIVRLLRLQQIACGYMVTDADEPIVLCDTKNPRLDCTVSFLEKLNHPAIVWARFRHDIDQLMDALGDRAVRYDGAVGDDECELAKQAFNAGDKQFFVGNPAKGARGLTLNAAKTVTYYSNTFKLRDRLQSEDRAHRIGQDGVDHGDAGFGVLYADILATGTVDMKIVAALRGKFNIAAQLTGDRLRDWI